MVLFASPGDAEAALRRLDEADVARCLAQRVRGQTRNLEGQEVRIYDSSARPLSFPAFGDRSAASQVRAEVEFEGGTASAYLDFVLVQKGRTLAILLFFSVVSPFSAAEKEALTATVVQRIGSD